jgi:Fic family protein
MNYRLICWTNGIYDTLTLDMATDTKEATFLLEKNKKDFVWHILRSFERLPISLPQTSAILDGFTVAGLTIADLLKVKRYGDAVDMLCHLVKTGEFSLSKEIACALHSIVSNDEVPDEQRGRFRTIDVALKNISYQPPQPVQLDNMWDVRLFNGIQNPLERGVAVFLYMSRAQFFLDANKRTAMLMMNGILISKAVKPFFIPDSEKGQFAKLFTEFYESGDADEFMWFAAELACP